MSFINNLLDISPFSWFGILAALIAGGIIGAERQISGKPIGIRTSILICLSTYIFTKFSGINPQGIPGSTRIIGQIITGVGFLGGGVILTKGAVVTGVTSAACIWILAAIGITIGLNHALTGIKISLLSVILLIGIDSLERLIPFLNKGAHRKRKKESDD